MPRKKAVETQDTFVEDFDLRRMVYHFTAGVVAVRNSGKSLFIRHLIYEHRDIPRGIVFYPEEENEPFYSFFFPPLYIHEGFTAEMLREIWTQQGLAKAKADALLKKEGIFKDTSLLIVGDDVMADDEWKNIPEVKKISKNGRHRNISTMFALQNAKDLGPKDRSNFNYVFLFRCNTHDERKKLYEVFGGPFGDYEDFKVSLAELTQDFGIMVLDLVRGTKLSNTVFAFRAKKDIENFIFGGDGYKKYHYEHFDEDYRERDFAMHNVYEENPKKKKIRTKKEKV